MYLLLSCAFTLLLAGDPDRFVAVPFSKVPFEVPFAPEPGSGIIWQPSALLDGYVVLDCPGEAFLDYPVLHSQRAFAYGPIQLVVHVTQPGEIRGRVFCAGVDGKQFFAHRFTLPATESTLGAKIDFYETMERHYRRLLDAEATGSAWFRHRIAEARTALAWKGDAEGISARAPTWRRSGFDDSFDLFTGERALAENLDLDRGLRIAKGEAATIDIEKITGITTHALDWKALVADMQPELDQLAKFIPADQAAVFFPSFAALVDVIDELDRTGSPLLAFASTSAQDQRTKERYQEQLCLPLSSISRLLGPTLISSIALTAGDPFLPSGSDLALLFESPKPAALESYMAVRYGEAMTRGAKSCSGEIIGVKYNGVVSADRRISSYLARIDDTLVVTNSLAQLRRIIAVRVIGMPALTSADEYIWFRDRYRRGDAEESAFLVLTDAAIRGWSGPRMRIAESRRVRAAAAMSELQARHFDELVAGTIALGTSAADATLPFRSDFVWTASGVHSPTWGNLGFLTPIAELELGKASLSERVAYETFRRGYESRWRNFFDPIALRLSVTKAGLGADLTVMPLVANSDYGEWIDLARDVKLAKDAGDPHADALVHFAMSLSQNSSIFQSLNAFFDSNLREYFGPDTLDWVGKSVAVYAERDPIWEELEIKTSDGGYSDLIYELPIAARIDCVDPRSLSLFLGGLHTFLENFAGAHWESRSWNGRSYERIDAEQVGSLVIYLVALPDSLTLSLREDVVKRAIDREVARLIGGIDASASTPWLGESVSLRVEREGLMVFDRLWDGHAEERLRNAAWLAIPILNEWKRRFPNEDPVRLHERLWGIRLASPGGGEFVWNEALQTMEATDYGSPASQKKGPALPGGLAEFARGEFGITFEHDGLRARVKVLRE